MIAQLLMMAFTCWCPPPKDKCAFSVQYPSADTTEIWGATTGQGCSTIPTHEVWPYLTPGAACARVQKDLCPKVIL